MTSEQLAKICAENERAWSHDNPNCPTEVATYMMASEIAYQSALLNEYLKKIANPLMTIEDSPWVWLTCNGMGFVVDRREVTGVAYLCGGNGVDDPKVQFGMKGGHPWSKAADGTVEEVCKKLRIPT